MCACVCVRVCVRVYVCVCAYLCVREAYSQVKAICCFSGRMSSSTIEPQQKQENAHNTYALLGGCISAHTTTAKAGECTQHTCPTWGMYISTHNHGKNKGMHTTHMPYFGDVYRHTQPRQKQENAHNTHALLGGRLQSQYSLSKHQKRHTHTYTPHALPGGRPPVLQEDCCPASSAGM